MVGSRRAWLALVAALVTAVTLAACADDSERRFANDPIEEGEVASPSVEVAEAEPTPTQAALRPQASPQTLLLARGAPDRLFFLQGKQLWSVSSDGSNARLILEPGGDRVAAVAPSPAADQVAVLLAVGDGSGSAALVILGADGRERRRVDWREQELTALASGGASASIFAPPILDWSPQGDQLLVVFEGGGLVTIPLPDGEPSPLAIPESLRPAAAAWSPAGSAVAFIASDGGGTGVPALYVASTGVATLDPVAVAPQPPGETRGIADVAWRPDGSGILFTEAAASGGIGTARDLFSISPGGQDLQLIASAGRVAPAAGVIGVVPSPDDRAVAYAIGVPAAGGLAFHSLWVQPLAGGPGYQVPMPAEETVTDAWWTDRGLVWRTVPDAAGEGNAYTGGAFALYRVDPGGEPVKMYTADPVDVASPVASPAASPPAAGTPAAT